LVKGLQSREGLGNDDEQRGLRVESLGLLGQVVGVDVGNVPCADSGIRIRLQCFIRHNRAQIGTADTDVDDGLDLLAGYAGPLTGADLVGERIDTVQGLTDILDDILTVDDVLAFILDRTTQCGMQHGAILGVVDVDAAVHLLDALIKLHVLGELSEEVKRLWLDEILRQIEMQVSRLEGEFVRTVCILREPRTQIYAFALQIIEMLLQRTPRRGLRRINRRVDGHLRSFRHYMCETVRTP
jgi:hypothetical protein